MNDASQSDNRKVYSVSQLNATVRGLLEQSFPLLWVEGEISNLARPRSGHWYFTLKDDQAQVRCAMFAGRNRLLRIKPADGDQVLIRARVGLYAPRGEFQLVAEHMEDAGAGALQRAFDALKKKLGDEGLFDASCKQALPAAPRRIGVITSPTGAAIRDVVSVIRRRFPLARMVLYPVPVQGVAAPAAIVKALQTAGHREECDALLLVRGGGSIEDLWAFNDEKVARAIVASPIPVVAGVGHETDITIADFAADLRAATPSAAAELVCPDQQALHTRVLELRRRLERQFRDQLDQAENRLSTINRRLHTARPQKRLLALMQQLDEREGRLNRAIRSHLQRQQLSLIQTDRRLRQASPANRLQHSLIAQKALALRLRQVMQRDMERRKTRLQAQMRQLHTVSPLATLERGYAIALDNNEKVIRSHTETGPGEMLKIRVAEGEIGCEVIECGPGTQYSKSIE